MTGIDSNQVSIAYTYLRVSRHEQAKGYSIQTQRDTCRSYCERNGYEILGEFVDEFTGTEHDRPGINALLDAIAATPPAVVVALDVDRLLGRDEVAQVTIKYAILNAGVGIEYTLGGSEAPDDQILVGIKALWARHENQQRIERTRRGKRGRAEAGYVLMMGQRTPFGYDYVSEPHKGWFIVNEAEAAVVRDMYDWLVNERLTTYAMAQRLWERGILTKGDYSGVVFKKAGRGEWSASTVRRILSNPLYKGEWYWGKTRRRKVNGKSVQVKTDPSEWVKVDVPALVDASLWERAQACLQENRTRATRNTKRDYLLRGMIFCQCGRRWTGRFKGAPRKHGYYRCPSSEREYWRLACDTRYSLRQNELEDAVWNQIVAFILDTDTMRLEIERQCAAHSADAAKRDQRLQAIDAGLADIDRKLGQLLDQALDGFPAEIIADKKRGLLEQRSTLESERQRLEASRSQTEITPEVEAMLQELAATVRTALPAMAFAERRQLLEMLQIRVDVLDQHHVQLSGLVSESVVTLSSG